MLAVNNVHDHLHFFVGLNPAQSISDMMPIAKSESSEWINKEKLTRRKFQWQEGYGAFSHSKSQMTSTEKCSKTLRWNMTKDIYFLPSSNSGAPMERKSIFENFAT
jgi:REP element-mobilizing transposase RayT